MRRHRWSLNSSSASFGGSGELMSRRYAATRSSSSACSSRPTARRIASSSLPASWVARPADRRNSVQLWLPGVDVFKLEPRVLQVLSERNVAESSQLCLPLAPSRRNGVANAAKHDVARHRVELKMTACRQKREAVAPAARRPYDCLRAAREIVDRTGTPSDASRRSRARCRRTCPAVSEVRARVAEGRASRYRSGAAKAAVSTFGTSMPSLNRSTVKTTCTSPAARSRSAAAGRSSGVVPDTATDVSRLVELIGHEPRVLDAHAEAQRAHLAGSATFARICSRIRRTHA